MNPNLILTGPQTQIADDVFGAVFDHGLEVRTALPYDVGIRFIERIGFYNEFEAGSVLDALARVDRVIPRSAFGPGNLNNGNRDYAIEVGREGSPAIYLKRFEWLSQLSRSVERRWRRRRVIEAVFKTTSGRHWKSKPLSESLLVREGSGIQDDPPVASLRHPQNRIPRGLTDAKLR